MTTTRHMFHPILAADPAPTWLALVIAGVGGIFGGAGLWGFLQSRLARRDAVTDSQRIDRKEGAKTEATVEVARVNADASERERLFAAWQTNETRYAAEVAAMREEMRQMRRTFGHEIRGIRQYLITLQDFYHSCFAALNMVAMQCRIMRARLKRQSEAAGDKFDEDEFPVVDIAVYDPKTLPKFQPSDGWDDPAPPNEKKMSGRITLTPDEKL